MNTTDLLIKLGIVVAGAHVVPAVVKGLAADGTATRMEKISHFMFGGDAGTVNAAAAETDVPAEG